MLLRPSHTNISILFAFIYLLHFHLFIFSGNFLQQNLDDWDCVVDWLICALFRKKKEISQHHFVCRIHQADAVSPNPKQPIRLQSKVCTSRLTTRSQTTTPQQTVTVKAATMASASLQGLEVSGVILVCHRVMSLPPSQLGANQKGPPEGSHLPSKSCSPPGNRKLASWVVGWVNRQRQLPTVGTVWILPALPVTSPPLGQHRQKQQREWDALFTWTCTHVYLDWI